MITITMRIIIIIIINEGNNDDDNTKHNNNNNNNDNRDDVDDDDDDDDDDNNNTNNEEKKKRKKDEEKKKKKKMRMTLKHTAERRSRRVSGKGCVVYLMQHIACLNHSCFFRLFPFFDRQPQILPIYSVKVLLRMSTTSH